MDFSDSDDDLLPNMNSLKDMFRKVAKQARRPDPQLVDPVASTSKATSNSGSKKPKQKSSEKRKASKSSQDSAEKSKRKKENGEHEFSSSTKNLLEELGQISAPVPCSSSSSSNPTSLGIDATEDVEDLAEDYPLDESINLEDIMDDEPIPIVEVCSLRIRWKQEVLRFKKPKNTKMAVVINELSLKLGIRADNLVILDDDTCEEVSDNALVDTIPFGKVLEAFELESSTSTTANPKNLDPDKIKINLQGRAGYRERFKTTIKKTTHVRQLVDDFVEKYRHHGKKFKLVFDGEELDLSETPETLDIENNDMIDVVEIV